jgi:hypothetical protein
MQAVALNHLAGCGRLALLAAHCLLPIIHPTLAREFLENS